MPSIVPRRSAGTGRWSTAWFSSLASNGAHLKRLAPYRTLTAPWGADAEFVTVRHTHLI